MKRSLPWLQKARELLCFISRLAPRRWDLGQEEPLGSSLPSKSSLFAQE